MADQYCHKADKKTDTEQSSYGDFKIPQKIKKGGIRIINGLPPIYYIY